MRNKGLLLNFRPAQGDLPEPQELRLLQHSGNYQHKKKYFFYATIDQSCNLRDLSFYFIF